LTKESKVKKSEMCDKKLIKGITENDIKLFKSGIHYEIYKKLGAHPEILDGQSGVRFAVWAPNAKWVSVIGDFNEWNVDNNKMRPIEESGIFELFISGALIGQRYKYVIETIDGDTLYKSDPYANYAEIRPGNASTIADISNFKWSDSRWMQKRECSDLKKKPMSIYEVHIG